MALSALPLDSSGAPPSEHVLSRRSGGDMNEATTINQGFGGGGRGRRGRRGGDNRKKQRSGVKVGSGPANNKDLCDSDGLLGRTFLGQKQSAEEMARNLTPETRRWVQELAPVLQIYAYDCSDIVDLVRRCEFDANRIANAVDAIFQDNIGRECGEWKSAEPPTNSTTSISAPGKSSIHGPTDRRNPRGLQDSSSVRSSANVPGSGGPSTGRGSRQVRRGAGRSVARTSGDQSNYLQSHISTMRNPIDGKRSQRADGAGGAGNAGGASGAAAGIISGAIDAKSTSRKTSSSEGNTAALNESNSQAFLPACPSSNSKPSGDFKQSRDTNKTWANIVAGKNEKFPASPVGSNEKVGSLTENLSEAALSSTHLEDSEKCDRLSEPTLGEIRNTSECGQHVSLEEDSNAPTQNLHEPQELGATTFAGESDFGSKEKVAVGPGVDSEGTSSSSYASGRRAIGVNSDRGAASETSALGTKKGNVSDVHTALGGEFGGKHSTDGRHVDVLLPPSVSAVVLPPNAPPLEAASHVSFGNAGMPPVEQLVKFGQPPATTVTSLTRQVQESVFRAAEQKEKLDDAGVVLKGNEERAAHLLRHHGSQNPSIVSKRNGAQMKHTAGVIPAEPVPADAVAPAAVPTAAPSYNVPTFPVTTASEYGSSLNTVAGSLGHSHAGVVPQVIGEFGRPQQLTGFNAAYGCDYLDDPAIVEQKRRGENMNAPLDTQDNRCGADYNEYAGPRSAATRIQPQSQQQQPHQGHHQSHQSLRRSQVVGHLTGSVPSFYYPQPPSAPAYETEPLGTYLHQHVSKHGGAASHLTQGHPTGGHQMHPGHPQLSLAQYNQHRDLVRGYHDQEYTSSLEGSMVSDAAGNRFFEAAPPHHSAYAANYAVGGAYFGAGYEGSGNTGAGNSFRNGYFSSNNRYNAHLHQQALYQQLPHQHQQQQQQQVSQDPSYHAAPRGTARLGDGTSSDVPESYQSDQQPAVAGLAVPAGVQAQQNRPAAAVWQAAYALYHQDPHASSATAGTVNTATTSGAAGQQLLAGSLAGHASADRSMVHGNAAGDSSKYPSYGSTSVPSGVTLVHAQRTGGPVPSYDAGNAFVGNSAAFLYDPAGRRHRDYTTTGTRASQAQNLHGGYVSSRSAQGQQQQQHLPSQNQEYHPPQGQSRA